MILFIILTMVVLSSLPYFLDMSEDRPKDTRYDHLSKLPLTDKQALIQALNDKVKRPKQDL